MEPSESLKKCSYFLLLAEIGFGFGFGFGEVAAGSNCVFTFETIDPDLRRRNFLHKVSLDLLESERFGSIYMNEASSEASKEVLEECCGGGCSGASEVFAIGGKRFLADLDWEATGHGGKNCRRWFLPLKKFSLWQRGSGRMKILTAQEQAADLKLDKLNILIAVFSGDRPAFTGCF